MKTTTQEITADDLRSERTWLLQHGMHEKTTVGGRSFLAAARELEKEVDELTRQINAMAGNGPIHELCRDGLAPARAAVGKAEGRA